MSYFRDNVGVPKLLRLDGKCIFLLFEHIVEHRKQGCSKYKSIKRWLFLNRLYHSIQ